MLKQIKKYIMLFVLTASVLSVILSCKIVDLMDEDETRTYQERKYFELDPNTILESLAQKKTDVFVPWDKVPDGVPLMPDTPVQWSSSDYYRIAQALFEYTREDSFSEWGLSSMTFGMVCEDAAHGPQEGRFVFFKTVKTRERESRLVISIWIEPWRNTVSFQEREDYPMLRNWNSIVFDKLMVSADDALWMAEMNGGAEARSSIENECDIGVILAPDGEYDDWQVRYESSDRRDLFAVRINPYSGGFKIIYPKMK